jgi:hypothetical protein
LRFLKCLLAFLAGLVAVAAVLFPLVPGDDRTSFDEAFESAPQCDLLFVGPSYIKYGFVPEAFEEESKRLGHPHRVCKYAREALRGYELENDLALVMKHPFPRLKTVVVDVTLSPKNIGFRSENWFTQRVVRWHTWRSLPWLYRHYEANRVSWLEDAPQILAHLQHVAMNYLGIGRGGTLLTQAREIESLLSPTAKARKKRRGLHNVERPRSGKAADVREYRKTREQLVAEKAGKGRRAASGDEDWPRELEPIVREAGYEPIFLYSPVLMHRALPRLERRGDHPLVFLDFDDPEHFPELYDYEVRAKGSHLSVRGAVLFSRRLAREMARMEEGR